MTVQKRALAHVDGPTGVGAKGADDVMGIVIIKTAEEDLSLVDLVIPIGVAQQHEMRALGQVDPFACQFKAGRQVEAVGKHCLLVRLSVAVQILVDEQFVIGTRISRLVMRVTGHGRNPQSTGVVKGHLYGVRQVGEAFLRGKKLYAEPISHRHGVDGILLIKVVGAAVFSTGSVVSLDGWQGVGCGISPGQIKVLVLEPSPDGLVAIGCQLLEFEQLVRVVVRTKGAMPATKDVDPVGDLVPMVPHPIFLHDGLPDPFHVTVVRGLCTEKCFSDLMGQKTVALFIQLEAIQGQRTVGGSEPPLA